MLARRNPVRFSESKPFSSSLFQPIAAVASGLLLLGSSWPLLAQRPSDQTVASAHTSSKSEALPAPVKEVSVLATVRDKHGKILSTLTANDFTLEEDNHPVTLSHFERQSQSPLKLGVLVDTSLSQRSLINQEKSDSKAFLDQILRDSDAAFLIHFDREVELLEDVTSSKTKLDAAMDKLETASFANRENSPDSGDPSNSPGGGRSGGHRMRRGGNTLYDAIYLASDELMKNQPGRRVLVVLSNGVDRGSKERLEDAIDAAQRTNTLVYALYAKGEEESGSRGGFGRPRMGGPMGGPRRRGGGGQSPREPRPDGKKTLEQITQATGGRLFEVSKKQSLGEIYGRIKEDLRNHYVLAFAPGQNDAAGYHKLELKLKPKDAEVQARAGFYWE